MNLLPVYDLILRGRRKQAADHPAPARMPDAEGTPAGRPSTLPALQRGVPFGGSPQVQQFLEAGGAIEPGGAPEIPHSPSDAELLGIGATSAGAAAEVPPMGGKGTADNMLPPGGGGAGVDPSFWARNPWAGPVGIGAGALAGGGLLAHLMHRRHKRDEDE